MRGIYLAHAWMVVGFALHAATMWTALPPSLVIHAFTVGGIGMMTRVTLGRAGRKVMRPPFGMALAFASMQGAALARVADVVMEPEKTAMWMLSMALAGARQVPMLLTPRADGRPE